MNIQARRILIVLAASSFLCNSSEAEQPPGKWKESPYFLSSDSEGNPKEDVARVWDSYPELGLEFEWSGGVNERREADGFGELIWKKDGERVSTFTGTMKNGMREGIGVVRMRNGSTYRGEWKANLKNGRGIYFHANGDYYEGGFERDQMSGRGSYSEADGTTYEGDFRNDRRHGQAKMTLLGGLSYQAEWNGGVESAESLAMRVAAKPPQQLRVVIDQDYIKRLESQNAGENALAYRSKMVGGEMLIEPDMEILDEWKQKGHVNVTGAMAIIGFGCGPVPLIVSVDNPGKAALTIEGGRLQIESSLPDLEPIIVFYGEDSDSIAMFDADGGVHMRFGLGNIGEGSATNCLLEFNITPWDAPVPKTFAFKRELGTLEDRLAVSLKSECATLGVKVDEVLAAASGNSGAMTAKRGRELLGQFAKFDKKGKWLTSNGRLTARLSYTWTDSSGKAHREQTMLQGTVILDPRNGLEFGAPDAAQGDYHLLLSLQKSNYSLPFPFRKRITGGGNTKLRLRIAAPKTSDHQFRVVLTAADGSELRSAPIKMHYFLPKGEKDFIENGKRKLASP